MMKKKSFMAERIAKGDIFVRDSKTGGLIRISKKDKDFKKIQAKLPINPHPHTTKQLNKMTKKGLIRLVIRLEKYIVYQIYKSKLPRLKTTRQKALPKRKTKRKFSRKQLAAQRLFAKRARAGTLRR
jgi:hypothetical protein